MGFSEYRPHGESLTFTRTFPADIESSEVLFADALRVLDHLAPVVHADDYAVRFVCAIDGTYIKVNEPEPSEEYWEILRENSPPPVDAPLPTTIKRFPTVTHAELMTTYRQALDEITCPAGFFVLFESIAPMNVSTRIMDSSDVPSAPSISVTLWDDTLNLEVTTRTDGTRWLTPLPEGSRYLPPVTFRIVYDTILVLNLDVNWGRWLDKGTGEHALLQSALDSLVADDWRLPPGGARYFSV